MKNKLSPLLLEMKNRLILWSADTTYIETLVELADL